MAPKVAEKAVKAPATKAPAAKKVVKKATAGASKKKVKAVESYKIYIYKVLKQVGTVLWCSLGKPRLSCSPSFRANIAGLPPNGLKQAMKRQTDKSSSKFSKFRAGAP